MAFLLRSERLGMGWLSVLEELCVMYMSLSKVLEAVKMRKKQGKQWVESYSEEQQQKVGKTDRGNSNDI